MRNDSAEKRRRNLEELYRVRRIQSDNDAIVALMCELRGAIASQVRAELEQEYVYGHGRAKQRRMKGGRPHFLNSILKGATGRDDINIPNVMLYLIEQVLLKWMQESGAMVARSAEVAGERFLNEILQMRIDDLPKDLWNKFINRLEDIYAKRERRLRMSADAAKRMRTKYPEWPQFENDLRLDVYQIIKEYIAGSLRHLDMSEFFREVFRLYDARKYFWNSAMRMMDDESIRTVDHGALALYCCLGMGTVIIFDELRAQKYGLTLEYGRGYMDELGRRRENERLKIASGDPSDKLRLYRCEFYKAFLQCFAFVEQMQRAPLRGWNNETMLAHHLPVLELACRAARFGLTSGTARNAFRRRILRVHPDILCEVFEPYISAQHKADHR